MAYKVGPKELERRAMRERSFEERQKRNVVVKPARRAKPPAKRKRPAHG